MVIRRAPYVKDLRGTTCRFVTDHKRPLLEEAKKDWQSLVAILMSSIDTTQQALNAPWQPETPARAGLGQAARASRRLADLTSEPHSAYEKGGADILVGLQHRYSASFGETTEAQRT